MPQVTEAEVYRACRTLFGPELHLSSDFLTYLQPSGVRSAYRSRAKVIHPDRFSATSPAAVKARQHRLFQDLNQAHQTVQSYLQQRGNAARSPLREPRPRPQRTRPDRPRPTSAYGFLPRRPLQFGQFLYYLGEIPFATLIAGITWQRRQRPLLGQIARRWGWLSDEQIRTVIHSRHGLNRFGEKAEHLGLLSSQQVRTLLFHQRSLQQRLGEYFVAHGLFDQATLNRLLDQLAEHNRRHRRETGGHYYYFHRP